MEGVTEFAEAKRKILLPLDILNFKGTHVDAFMTEVEEGKADDDDAGMDRDKGARNNTWFQSMSSKAIESIRGDGTFLPDPEDGNLKVVMWKVLDCPETSVLSRWVNVFLMSVIVVSIGAYCLSTEPFCTTVDAAKNGGDPEPLPAFYTIEVVCVSIFTLEYVGKLCLAHAAFGLIEEEPAVEDDMLRTSLRRSSRRQASLHAQAAKNATHWENAVRTARWVRSPLNVIDLLAILPFYIQIATDAVEPSGGAGAGFNLSWVRVLRLTRIVRIFKIAKFSNSLTALVNAIRDSADELMALASLWGMLLIVLGAMVHFFEQEKYEGALGYYTRQDLYRNGEYEQSPFQSIPQSFWWVIVTMTTVGYGDFYPTTVGGKFTALLTMFVGVIMIAFVASIVNSHFGRHMESGKEKEELALMEPLGFTMHQCGDRYTAKGLRLKTDAGKAALQKLNEITDTVDRCEKKVCIHPLSLVHPLSLFHPLSLIHPLSLFHPWSLIHPLSFIYPMSKKVMRLLYLFERRVNVATTPMAHHRPRPSVFQTGLPFFPPGSDIRVRIFRTFEDSLCSYASEVMTAFILVVILISTVGYILGTVPAFTETTQNSGQDCLVFDAAAPVLIHPSSLNYQWSLTRSLLLIHPLSLTMVINPHPWH